MFISNIMENYKIYIYIFFFIFIEIFTYSLKILYDLFIKFILQESKKKQLRFKRK